MVERFEQRIRVWHPDGREHQLAVLFAFGPEAAIVGAMYEHGCSDVAPGTGVALWRADYVSPAGSDEGQVWFGDGRIDIQIDSLKGIGVGSLLMRPLVRWAQSRPYNVPVVPIDLSGDDANTEEERERRNRFYEKLGFVFNYDDSERTYGVARKMLVSEIIPPAFKMSGEWQVETLAGAGCIFPS